MTDQSPPAEADAPDRQCGRCRQMFERDPLDNRDSIQDWWLCPPCHEVLHGAPRA